MTKNGYLYNEFNLLLIICCCISCNETLFKNPGNRDFYRKRTELQANKHSRAQLWGNSLPSSAHKQQKHFSNKRKAQTEHYSYSNILPQDLIGEEAMSIPNSIWDKRIDQFHSSNDNWVIGKDKSINRFVSNDFEKNFNGLVDDFLYDDYYEDYYDYPSENVKPHSYLHHTNIFRLPHKNQKIFHPSRLSPHYGYHAPIIKADRRSDGPQPFQKHSTEDTKKNPQRQERKQIISGIDSNPLTSNALISLSNDDPYGNPYDLNDVFSDVRAKTDRVKNIFDGAVINIGDATIGRIKKKKLKSDIDYMITGIKDTVNKMEVNSINTNLRHRLEEAMNLKTMDRWEADREYIAKKDGMKQKLPGIIQRFKDNAKNVGNYVFKQANQILVEPSPIMKTNSALPKLTKKGQNDRQAIDRQAGAASLFSSLMSGFGGGLFATGGPVAAGFSVTLLVLLEVVSMGIESALQINEPTVATTTELTTTTTQGKY